MKQINFKFLKDNKETITASNLNAMQINKELYFIIDSVKYTYIDNKLIKENKDEKIILDFNNNNCKIELNNKYVLNLNITYNNIKKEQNKVIITYKIETEDNVLNEINIEYI